MTHTLSQEVFHICEKVGEFIREKRKSVSAKDIVTKDHNSFVSYVDREAERRLVRSLSKIFPNAGFVTEEETIKQTDTGLHWIIDPLDGTTNYLHGLPIYSISIGLSDGDKLVAGFIMDIPGRNFYSAEESKGAFKNFQKIQVSQCKKLKDALVATGFPYQKFEKLENYMKLLETCMYQTRGVRRLGSAAMDLAYVAEGNFDLFYEYNLNAWDVAGGACLVREAGGEVLDFSGKGRFIENKELIATNPYLSEAFLQWVDANFSK